MRRDRAERIEALVSRFIDELKATLDDMRKDGTKDEYAKFQTAYYGVLKTVLPEIILPIHSEYPDLLAQELELLGNFPPEVLQGMQVPIKHPADMDFGSGTAEWARNRYVPRHKQDLQRGDALASLDRATMLKILPDLLEWVQDGNWPVAGRVGRSIAGIGDSVAPYLQAVFEGKDDQWKYNCIVCVINAASPELVERLGPLLERLAKEPTSGEKAEGVDEVASEALLKFFGGKAS